MRGLVIEGLSDKEFRKTIGWIERNYKKQNSSLADDNHLGLSSSSNDIWIEYLNEETLMFLGWNPTPYYHKIADKSNIDRIINGTQPHHLHWHIHQWIKEYHPQSLKPDIEYPTLPFDELNTPSPIKSMPDTTNQNPYELMVESITHQVLERIPRQYVLTKAEVTDMVAADLGIFKAALMHDIAERVKDIGHTHIVLEDRRKSPSEIKDINEPVHSRMPDIIGILKAGCWACAVGPSGSGKTLGALQYAKLASIPIVCSKQMSRMLAPHDLIGFIDANGKYRAGAWTNAILGHPYDNSLGQIPDGTSPKDTASIILIDEMDNANENIIMLVKALPTGQIMMPYGMQRINPNLTVMATMNTWGTGATREYVGRMAQDAALLNEFSFVEWDYDTTFEWVLLEGLFQSYKDPGEYTIQHMQMLHSMFKGMRAKAEAQKVRVIISTRNIMNAAKKLIENPTWPINKVLHMDIYKGLKEEDIQRIACPEQVAGMCKDRKKQLPQKNILADTTNRKEPSQKRANGIPF